MMAPKDATHTANGLFYKVGRHNKIYYWADDEWKLSSVKSLQQFNEISNANKKLSKRRH